MSDEHPHREAVREQVVRWLVEKTGITEPQARDLVDFLGVDTTSLLREARIIKRGGR